jgi:uncharacterized protein
MIPFRFGPPPQPPLFGLHHPAAVTRTQPAAVLLCPPYGQEAIRTHRMLRVLAERLARHGTHALRFDFFGTGDSAGEDTEGHFARWRDDLLLAHLELQRRAPGAPVTWVGIRLGATLACLASAAQPVAPPVHLVLWEPVTHGVRYRAELATNHAKALRASYSLVPKGQQGVPVGEALGFALGAALSADFERLQAATLPAVAAPRVTLIAPPGHRDAAELAGHLAAHRTPCQSVAFEHAFDWSSEEALNTALVPHEALQLLASAVADGQVPA